MRLTSSFPPALSRRRFLTTSAQLSAYALAGVGLGARTLSATEVGRHNAQAFLEDPPIPERLRQLAAQALDAARSAGAQFADIRIGHTQILGVGIYDGVTPDIVLESTLSYGVRAMVRGAVAFEYGTLLSPDAVARTARNAVAQAKGFAALINDTELVSAPVVQGEWHSPMTIDPFTVPILEQADLLGAYSAAVDGRVEGAGGFGAFTWERETRVCATTDGTCTTQTFVRALPYFNMFARWFGMVGLKLPEFGPRLSGYEYVTQPGIQERIKAYGDTAMRYARLRSKALDIGRYPVVFDGESTATLLNSTVGPALQLDRALGFEADTSGGSFLTPPMDMLGTAIFSPSVSIATSRPASDISGAKWDDEGVAPSPTPMPLVADGRLVDYFTDRRTALALRDWYAKRHTPLVSRGYSVARTADSPVLVGTGHLTMDPASSRTSLEDLTRQLKRGLLLIQASYVATDQQLASGFFYGTLMLEVNHGQITNRIKNVALQFKTTTLWKGVEAIGDSTTLGTGDVSLAKGQPWQRIPSTSRAPAMSCKAIDVIQVPGQ